MQPSRLLLHLHMFAVAGSGYPSVHMPASGSRDMHASGSRDMHAIAMITEGGQAAVTAVQSYNRLTI